jgi:hypothetical protein
MTNNSINNNFILKLRSISGVFDAAKIKHGLLAMEYDVQTLPSEDGTIFFINGISTRPLLLNFNAKGLDLSLPSFSCPDDWELLRDWLLVFFTFHQAVAIAENDLIEDVESFFSAEKIGQEQMQFEEELHRHMRDDETFHFQSVHRAFFAGTKIFERIREQPENEHLSYFYQLVRKSQYTTLNAENSFVEKISEHLSTTFSCLDNKANIVLQPADMIKIHENATEDFFISYSSIDKLIRHGWIYLDEKQIYIPVMSDEEWKNFCSQAKEMSINTELFSKYVEGEDEENE